MSPMVDQRRMTFGTTIGEAVTAATTAAEQFGRELEYLSRDPAHTTLVTRSRFSGDQEVAFSFRPVADGRCSLTISSSVENMATDFSNEMARYLPE